MITGIVPRENRLFQGIVRFLSRHHELVKFALVGFTTMIVDISIFYSLTLSFMGHKPTIAKIFAGTVAMGVSYILNTLWSFKNRGGRARHHEAFLFFLISSIGIGIGAAPEFFVTTLTNWRATTHGVVAVATVDFVVNYIIGNCAQMVFRFWALRKFAYPESVEDVYPDFTYESIPEEVGVMPHAAERMHTTGSGRPATKNFPVSPLHNPLKSRQQVS